MAEFNLTGILPPLVTPFTPDGQIDETALRQLVDRQIAAGVDGLFAMGSTGEVAYLTNDERYRIVDIVLDQAAGRVPVLVGCIETTGKRVVEQAKHYVGTGVAALVIAAPFYAINSPAEIADQFRLVRDAVDLPLVAYDVPVRTHHKMGFNTLVELGQEGTIVGVKDSSGDDVGFRRLILANRAVGSPLKLYTGHEIVCDGTLLGGADGIVPGLANVDPDGYVAMWRARQAGDWTAVARIQDILTNLMDIAFQAPGRSGDAAGVGGFKTAMAYLGYLPTATMASPIQPLDQTAIAGVHAAVDRWRAEVGK